MEKPKIKVMSSSEELDALQKLTERVQKDPQIGVRMLQKAGMVDKDGKWASRYRKAA